MKLIKSSKALRVVLPCQPGWESMEKVGEHGEHGEHGKDGKHQPADFEDTIHDSKHSFCDSKHSFCDSKHSILQLKCRWPKKCTRMENNIIGQLKMGEHQAKCRALKSIWLVLSIQRTLR